MNYIDLIKEQEKNDGWFLRFCKNWLFIHEVNAMPAVEGSNGKFFYILRIFPFGWIPILNHLVVNIPKQLTVKKSFKIQYTIR